MLVTAGPSYIAKHCISGLRTRGYSIRTTLRDLNRSKIVKSDIETFLNEKVEIEFFQTDMHIASPVPAKHTGNNDNLILRIFFLVFIRPVFQYIAGLVVQNNANFFQIVRP